MSAQMVLIAEDDMMIQKLLKRMFKRAGFPGECVVVSTGTDAVASLQAHREEVVVALLDTGLAGYNDAGLFDALRAISPALPIFASSGYSPEELKGPRHFDGRALAGFLSKPFSMNDVRALCEAQKLIPSSEPRA